MRRPPRAVVTAMLLALLAQGCRQVEQDTARSDPRAAPAGPRPVARPHAAADPHQSFGRHDEPGSGQLAAGEDDETSDGEPDGEGLSARLEIATAPAEEQREPAHAEPLDDETTAALLARLADPPQPSEAPDAGAFAFPPSTLPPPLAGATVARVFPPSDERQEPRPPSRQLGPLSVQRHAPEGEVPLAPSVSVTFDRAMVPVATLDDLRAQDVPLRLEPPVAGTWRWIGTRTLLLQPEAGRLPAATRTVAEVPAGTRAMDGALLPVTVRWEFATPPPRLQRAHPEGQARPRQAVHVAVFDQRIEPRAVLATIRLLTAGGDGRETAHPVRLARDEELAADEAARRLVAEAEPGHWLAFVPEQPLPPESRVEVAIGPGTPSAEGARVTDERQQWLYEVHGPLRLVGSDCGFHGALDACAPGSPLRLEFSTPLAPGVVERALQDELVTIEPLPPGGVTLFASGRDLVVYGATQPRVRYTVTAGAELADVYGQTLGESVAVTFEVGPAPPTFEIAGGAVVVADPFDDPHVRVRSVNVPSFDVLVRAVAPGDYPRFLASLDRLRRELDPVLPGRRVAARTVQVAGPADEPLETLVGLSSAFPDDRGHALVLVTADVPHGGRTREVRALQWVQRTALAVDAAVDADALVARVSRLADGVPVASASVRLLEGEATVLTDADGLARLPLPASASGPTVLLAELAGDVALLPQDRWGHRFGSGWTRQAQRPRLVWEVWDDRGTYRPGESVHLKGWVRQVDPGPEGGTRLPDGAVGRTVRWTLRDARGADLAAGESALDAFAGFTFAAEIPAGANLGPAHVALTLADADEPGAEHHHGVQVQEFRRPEYEVTVEADGATQRVGESALLTATAAYYAGGGLPAAPVEWIVTAVPGAFRPPGWPGFTFGAWTPWWGGHRGGWARPPEPRRWTQQAVTDATGRAALRLHLDAITPPRATSVTVEAAVTDVNRQRWAGRRELLVHPAQLYVGLRAERSFVGRGEPYRLDAVVADLDGRAVPGRTIALRAARLQWVLREGAWKEEEAEVLEEAVLSEDGPVSVVLRPATGGSWRLTARVLDLAGRPNETELSFWVSGGHPTPGAERAELQAVQLVPDRDEYGPGDVAELLVLAPFADGHGLLTTRRGGLLAQQPFTLEGGSAVLSVPVAERHLPALHVQVEVVGQEPRTDLAGEPLPGEPPRPAFAAGGLRLPVSLESRRLHVELQPHEGELPPGARTSVAVTVRDAQGEPVQDASVALAVVDEAILALSDHGLPDPLAAFHPEQWSRVSDHRLREMLLLARRVHRLGAGEGGGAGGEPLPVRVLWRDELLDADGEPEELLDAATGAEVRRLGLARGAASDAPPGAMVAAGLGFGKAGDAGAAPVAARTVFDALALFVPDARTGADGRLTVELTLPESLTRWRVMAVAVDRGDRAGTAEAALTARLPLMVRPSLPRFLRAGDLLELPVVLQNGTDRELTAQLALATANLPLLQAAGYAVRVPARDRVEVRVPARAGGAGEARVAVIAADASRPATADAAALSFPVWTPATTEAFAGYGELDEGAVVQPVLVPHDVAPYGGLQLTTSSTALAALTDAVIAIVRYPYGCTEQRASRLLAVAALRDVLVAFAAEGLPPDDELAAMVADDLQWLADSQRADDGWGFWEGSAESDPWVSLHVAHALVGAREAGFDVPQEALARALSYASRIDEILARRSGFATARLTIVSYALFVRARAGDRDRSRARDLLAQVGPEGLPLEASGLLLAVLAGDDRAEDDRTALLRHLENRVAETASTAQLVEEYGDGEHVLLHGARRTDALVLTGLLAAFPQHDLLPKLVRGLLGHRVRGHWGSTQENVFVLLALSGYFQRFEAREPDFTARVWLGGRLADEQRFAGRGTARNVLEVPLAVLTGSHSGTLTELVLQKEGAGRLYWRLGLSYAPADLSLAAREEGFAVARVYEALDERSQDVSRDEDGTWRVALGASVRVRLTLVAPSRRHHVALADALPAGFEAVNLALAVSGSLPPEARSGTARSGGQSAHTRWWYRPWYEHENLRDERAEAFAGLLPAGVYEYVYVARATTPGRFVVPPVKAEEMYAPETFGRSASDVVVVR